MFRMESMPIVLYLYPAMIVSPKRLQVENAVVPRLLEIPIPLV